METLDQVVLADELQMELQDLLCLTVDGDHVRWVLTGDDVAGLARWLIDAADRWREWADQVAKRLVVWAWRPTVAYARWPKTFQ